MADINFSDEALKSILSAEILKAISQEDRDKMIQSAIRSWMADKDGSGYGSKTKLQQAIDRAVSDFASDVVRESFESNAEMKAMLTDIVATATTKAMTEIRANIERAVSKTVADAISKTYKEY